MNPHQVLIEELVLHLDRDHGCAMARNYVQSVCQYAANRKRTTTPVGPNGDQVVIIDPSEEIERVAGFSRLQMFHAEHSHAGEEGWPELHEDSPAYMEYRP